MNSLNRRTLLTGGAAIAALGVLGTPGALANAASAPGKSSSLPRPSPAVIRTWAADTWASMVAMTDERTGLTADNIEGPLGSPTRSGYTSPTNIGGFLWSALVARDLGLISRPDCSARIRKTLRTLSTMRHHEPSGMYYNWYDEATGEVLTRWPTDGNAGLPVPVQRRQRLAGGGSDGRAKRGPAEFRARAQALGADELRRLLQPRGPTGNAGRVAPWRLLGRGATRDQTTAVRGNYLRRGADVWYTGFHYDTTVSETRIASYIAIARGQIPAKHYFATWRTFPDVACDWSWQEQRPVGTTRNYLGIDVFEGAYTYRGMRIVPGWGGSMFEALMPAMFVPEETWAPRSWGVNHPLTVRAHREHGLEEAKYGYWGFSPSSEPGGGYREYGVDAIGLNPDGYLSDAEKTDFDRGYDGCRVGTNATPAYGDGVVTPHALFLAMHMEPREAYDNLRKLVDIGAYGEGGFYDAVAVKSGTVAKRYLSLDQAMVMGSDRQRLRRRDDPRTRSPPGRSASGSSR